jgi:RNA polymerase nonessential primary-like sigma factor
MMRQRKGSTKLRQGKKPEMHQQLQIQERIQLKDMKDYPGLESKYTYHDNDQLIKERVEILQWQERMKHYADLLGRPPTAQEWYLYSGITYDEFQVMEFRLTQITNALLTANKGYVYRIAIQWVSSHASQHEMIQAGLRGLERAIRNYDTDHGAKFSVYARYWIVEEIRQEHRKHAFIGHVPKGKAYQLKQYEEHVEELSQKLKRPPKREEIMEKTGWSLKVIASLEAANMMKVRATENDSDMANSGNVDHKVEAGGWASKKVQELLDKHLTERESELVRLRYGLGHPPIEMSNVEIAAAQGVSRAYVSGVLNKALQKINATQEIHEILDELADAH